MAELFRFSYRPNRAAAIAWRPWGRAAFEDAARTDRPVLLNLTTVWCPWCRRMDETTYSDPSSIELINEAFVAIRVDADCHPHIQSRYSVSGSPTNAFLTPGGEILWAGAYVAPAEFRLIARGVLDAWRTRRAELDAEIDRRRKAMEAARSRQPAIGLMRREVAVEVLSIVMDSFDARYGGFGEPPKFPCPDALELLFTRARAQREPAHEAMAARTLDGILEGELWDEVDGGFFRAAEGKDWTRPSREKLLETHAGLLAAYALGAVVCGRAEWRAAAERIVAWVEGSLHLPGGHWAGSQEADPEYYALSDDERRLREAPRVDPVLYTDRVARWIRALADAGGRLGREDWVERAAAGLDALLDGMAGPQGLLYHYRVPGRAPEVPGLLVDGLEAARAALSVAEATGRAAYLARARSLADALERTLWADDGGFLDHVPSAEDVGALRYRDRPFELNVGAARLFNDLALATGERSYRAIAERTLVLLAPLAVRHGVAGAGFALAAGEFFEPPPRIVITGDAERASPLRWASLTLPVPARRVWSLEDGGRIGTLSFPVKDRPAAYVCGGKTCSSPIVEPERLAVAVSLAR